MESFGELFGKPKSEKLPTKLTREILFLAEQSAEGDLKVLPGSEWSLHYLVDAESRKEKIQGLKEGKYTAEDVAQDLKPDALFYNINDIEKVGLESVSGRIRDLSAFIAHYDYSRFADFVEGMRGHDISMDDIDDVYSDITKARVQKKMMDSYGYTGRKQIEGALRNETKTAMDAFGGLSRSKKVLRALKANWLNENTGLVAMEEKDTIISQLSGDERALFRELEASYRDYIQNGNEEGYQKLVESIRDGMPKIQKDISEGSQSDNMKELEKELEKYKDEVVPPGSPEDPAIPPEDSDEYHTPPSQEGESKEKILEKSIFEIKPPLGGYYISGRKSYYDIDSKTWSKKKQLVPYMATVESSKGSIISGVLDKGLKSLPIPNGYAVDATSLTYEGREPKILRDQNGCFYLEAQGAGAFSVQFSKEAEVFSGQPIAEDTSPLYRGILSEQTERVISRLGGGTLQKAEQVRRYILANHFYPGAGDLEKAQALQYKLRSESTGTDYLQNIDSSEYLECYLANTKFIAMVRKAGIPARLVVGHKIEGAQKGKSLITQSTGHAWSEVWDGKAWRRFDATPQAKPEDKKESDKNNDQSKQESVEEADDHGVEGLSLPQESSDQDKQEAVESRKPQKGKAEKGESYDQSSQASENPFEDMPDASDKDVSQAETQLEEAKTQIEKMKEAQHQMDEKIAKAEKFKDISDLQKEIEESDLLDDLKEDLSEKLEAKTEQMKDKIKDELDKMVEEGFMDEKKRDEILKELEQKETADFDRIQKAVEQENSLYTEYENIREEVQSLVDKWFKYFAERLPRQDDVNIDEDSLTRQGTFNRKAVMKSRNLLFGTVKNPREVRPSIKPRFMSSVLVDVSGSMAGEKLKNARKLLIFYSELFSRISKEFGYVLFSINTFSDSVTEIKEFKQEYDSPQRYDYKDGTTSTVKVRLMQQLTTRGGTNMLDGIKKAADDLNKQVEEYPDYASALYFVGDGGDTCGNGANISKFLQVSESERGFGEHMYSAILLGNESQREELAEIFGDDHTNVAPDFDELIEKSMDKFDDDLEEYLKNKTR